MQPLFDLEKIAVESLYQSRFSLDSKKYIDYLNPSLAKECTKLSNLEIDFGLSSVLRYSLLLQEAINLYKNREKYLKTLDSLYELEINKLLLRIKTKIAVLKNYNNREENKFVFSYISPIWDQTRNEGKYVLLNAGNVRGLCLPIKSRGINTVSSIEIGSSSNGRKGVIGFEGVDDVNSLKRLTDIFGYEAIDKDKLHLELVLNCSGTINGINVDGYSIVEEDGIYLESLESLVGGVWVSLIENKILLNRNEIIIFNPVKNPLLRIKLSTVSGKDITINRRLRNQKALFISELNTFSFTFEKEGEIFTKKIPLDGKSLVSLESIVFENTNSNLFNTTVRVLDRNDQWKTLNKKTLDLNEFAEISNILEARVHIERNNFEKENVFSSVSFLRENQNVKNGSLVPPSITSTELKEGLGYLVDGHSLNKIKSNSPSASFPIEKTYIERINKVFVDGKEAEEFTIGIGEEARILLDDDLFTFNDSGKEIGISFKPLNFYCQNVSNGVLVQGISYFDILSIKRKELSTQPRKEIIGSGISVYTLKGVFGKDFVIKNRSGVVISDYMISAKTNPIEDMIAEDKQICFNPDVNVIFFRSPTSESYRIEYYELLFNDCNFEESSNDLIFVANPKVELVTESIGSPRYALFSGTGIGKVPTLYPSVETILSGQVFRLSEMGIVKGSVQLSSEERAAKEVSFIDGITEFNEVGFSGILFSVDYANSTVYTDTSLETCTFNYFIAPIEIKYTSGRSINSYKIENNVISFIEKENYKYKLKYKVDAGLKESDLQDFYSPVLKEIIFTIT